MINQGATAPVRCAKGPRSILVLDVPGIKCDILMVTPARSAKCSNSSLHARARAMLP
jgi:hypothetical protein